MFMFPDLWMAFFPAITMHFKKFMYYSVTSVGSWEGMDKFADAVHHLEYGRPCSAFRVPLLSFSGIVDISKCKILSWWKNYPFVPSESYLCTSEVRSCFHSGFSVQKYFNWSGEGGTFQLDFWVVDFDRFNPEYWIQLLCELWLGILDAWTMSVIMY